MSYNKAYYETHKLAMQASQRAWRQHKKEKMIEDGLIKPKKSKEERYQEILNECKHKYKNNIDGFRDRALKRFKDRYHSDSEFRKHRIEYHKKWIEKKKGNKNKIKPS